MPGSGTSSQTVTGGELFYDSGGSGSDYRNGESGIITFNSAEGTVIRVVFEEFNVETSNWGGCWDYLDVYDGVNVSSTSLSLGICGTSSFTVISTGSSITFEFYSDGSVRESGWKAMVEVLDESEVFCVPSSVSGQGRNNGYIRNVLIGDINNDSDSDGYTDYTGSQSTNIYTETDYSITITNGATREEGVCTVWIDWNDDGDFDDSDETITTSATFRRNRELYYSATISPPSGTVAGNVRMRIRISRNGATACENTTWGEIEDYTLNIIAGSEPNAADCIGAKTICNPSYNEPSPDIMGQGDVLNELPAEADCVPNEKNGIWYAFSPKNTEAANLKFSITPNNNDDDYDWIIFDITDIGCEGVADVDVATSDAFVSGNTYGASNWWDDRGPTGADSDKGSGNCNGPGSNNGSIWNADILVNPGHSYVLYVSNWSESTNGYQIDFDQGGTAIIYDDVPPNLDGVVQACSNSNELEVQFTETIPCGSLSVDDMTVTIGASAYNVIDIFSSDCDSGGSGSDNYVFTLDRVITDFGQLILSIESYGISDMCGNINSTESTLTFDVVEVNPVGIYHE